MSLTGSEFNAEKGSRGNLLKWIWAKIYPKINAVIPTVVQLSGSSWHYHCRFSSYGSNNDRIWDIKAYSLPTVNNMATQVIGIDSSPVPFSGFNDFGAYKDYNRGFVFQGGQTYFIKFFEVNGSNYTEVYNLKFIPF